MGCGGACVASRLAASMHSMNYSNLRDVYVCRGTIHNAIYALAVGELRNKLIIWLRQNKMTRRT